MNSTLFCIYAVITLLAVIFLSLREFHMLQLNGYKTPEHSWWMKKNYKRYIFPVIMLLSGVLLYTVDGWLNLLPIFCIAYIIIAVLNKPGKKFKKPLVYTARVKRMMTTFFIIYAIFLIWAYLLAKEGKVGADKYVPFGIREPYFILNTAVWLTPVLVPLANLINKPIETAVQKWYINDAKKILASCHNLHKVGITGSYGKTSMKFYLSELLSSQFETLKTPESFNTPMGVTITIRRDLKPTHEYFICEMGARRVREIKELCEIAHPHDGIITSVGPQHLETFNSIENVLNTKFELADSVKAAGGKIYLNGDNELIRKKAREYENAVLYGTREDCDYRASDISVSDRGTEFTLTAPTGESCRFSMKLLGEHSVQNVAGALAYCHGIGIPFEKLLLPVKRIAAVPHRLQLLDKGGDLTFIDDAYNSNPSGCRAALGVLELFDACKILVTPGMVELGAKQEELNFEFGQEAAKVCDYIALVGKNQTVPIYNGIKDAGFDMSKVYVADSLGEALDKVRAYQTDKKKIVLLENDLPDNY